MPKLPQVSTAAPLNGTRKTETVRPAVCFCLCGEAVNPRSTFRQGHDQRFIGQLAIAVVDGALTNERVEQLQLPAEVDDFDIEERINLTLQAVAKTVSEALAAKFEKAARNYWDKVTEAKATKAAAAQISKKNKPSKTVEHPGTGETVDLQAAYDEPDPRVQDAHTDEGDLAAEIAQDAETVLGTPVKIKVGRWFYNAVVHGMSQAGKVTAVRYYGGKDGEKEFVKTEGQFTIVD